MPRRKQADRELQNIVGSARTLMSFKDARWSKPVKKKRRDAEWNLCSCIRSQNLIRFGCLFQVSPWAKGKRLASTNSSSK